MPRSFEAHGWIVMAQDGGAFWVSLMPFVLIGLLFYFMLIRPERRKRDELAQMQSNLRKNDHVLTAAGIYGVVVNVQKGSEDVTIRVDEGNNTKLRVLRSAIVRVLTAEEAGNKDTS